MSVGEIVAAVEVGQSTVSEHLRRLAETCFVLVEHRGASSLFRINERCIACFPSAAELVMGEAKPDSLPAPRPGATSRAARREARVRPARMRGNEGGDGEMSSSAEELREEVRRRYAESARAVSEDGDGCWVRERFVLRR